MKKWINIVIFIVASVGMYILIHEMTHLFFCLVNPDAEVLEFNFGINNSVVWISDDIGWYTELISYSSNIFMFILPFFIYFLNAKKNLHVYFLTSIFVLINILILIYNIFYTIQQELMWLNSTGVLKYVLFVSFTIFFAVVVIEIRKLKSELKNYHAVFLLLLVILTNFIIYASVGICFSNNYNHVNEMDGQEISLEVGGMYLIYNDSNTIVYFTISNASDNDIEICLGRNQYIRITCDEEQETSVICTCCNEEIVLEIYKYIGGDS